jgi:hypothetical protein
MHCGRTIFRKAGLSGKQPAARIRILAKSGQFRETDATKVSVNFVAIPVQAVQFLLPDLELRNKVE